nr:fibropellin-1-like [Lytechinus pictus]
MGVLLKLWTGLLFLVIFRCGTFIAGYSTGPPDSACSDLLPGHVDDANNQIQPQQGTLSPYLIFRGNQDKYDLDNPITVTILRNPGVPGSINYRGFAMKAVANDSVDAPAVGIWTGHPVGFRYGSCSSGPNRMVTHDSSAEKGADELREFLWRADEDYGEIRFISTFVIDRQTFYTNRQTASLSFREDPCLTNNPCLNGGLCSATVQPGTPENVVFSCTCFDPWEGDTCQTQIEGCRGNPCVNGDCTDNGGSSYTCSCYTGWTGLNCDSEIDECLSSPCVNGACVNKVNGYNCTCQEGWVGTLCNVVDNGLCSSDLCQNEGECVDAPFDYYSCKCTNGYYGNYCELGQKDIEYFVNKFDELQSPNYPGSYPNDIDRFYTVLVHGATTISFTIVELDLQENIDELSYGYDASLATPLGTFTGSITNHIKDVQGDFVWFRLVTDGNNPQSTNYVGFSITYEADIDDCATHLCENGATCVDVGVGAYRCDCTDQFEGILCRISIVPMPCASNPCNGNGDCRSVTNDFQCDCYPGFLGQTCNIADPCFNNPCLNNCDCSVTATFTTSCLSTNPFITGSLCEIVHPCNDPQLCENGGNCNPSGSSFSCSCLQGFVGDVCQHDDPCEPVNPCQNSGTCNPTTDGTSFTCACILFWGGSTCTDPLGCDNVDCQNGGTCNIDSVSGNFDSCVCTPEYYGPFCSNAFPCTNQGTGSGVCNGQGNCENIEVTSGIYTYRCTCNPGYVGLTCRYEDPCSAVNDPCQNNGVCSVMFLSSDPDAAPIADCSCPVDLYYGDNCENAYPCTINPCLSGGTCMNIGLVDYDCNCTNSYIGERCQAVNPCNSNPCLNGGACDGSVVSGTTTEYRCNCTGSWTGQRCEIGDCSPDNPCMNGATCQSTSSGTFQSCLCPPGYTGPQCETEILCYDTRNPCQNNAACTSTDQDQKFVCTCLTGFLGPLCQHESSCNSQPCTNSGTCNVIDRDDLPPNYSCDCPEDYYGSMCQNTKSCLNDPCLNGGTCDQMTNTEHSCNCLPEYTGMRCQYDDPCLVTPCLNGGTCSRFDDGLNRTCICTDSWIGDDCSLDGGCNPDNPCRNGQCVSDSSTGSFVRCDCDPGFIGSVCQTIDPCFINPCRNGGQCNIASTNVAQHVCTCAFSWTGSSCEIPSGCNPNPCNGETCIHNTLTGELTRCDCPLSRLGDNCEFVNPCNSDPCQNGGECEVTPGIEPPVYQCSCPYEWVGGNCQEAGGCQGTVCLNLGTCVYDFTTGEHIRCDCTSSYTGANCQIVRPCSTDPCQNGATCNPMGDSVYSCICTTEWVGRHCNIDNPCIPNPCQYGGTCEPTNQGTFSCSCRDGFTGTRCEDAKLCQSRPCFNNGQCSVNDAGTEIICDCPMLFSGPLCQDSDECAMNPCLNDGICRPNGNTFTCQCQSDFTGGICETPVSVVSCNNECSGNGACIPDADGNFLRCLCFAGFTGPRCETAVSVCDRVECLNGGSCFLRGNNGFICSCAVGFRGTLCEIGDGNTPICAVNTCFGRGTCDDSGNAVRCVCNEGYTGQFCQTTVSSSQCSGFVCLNGGSCFQSTITGEFICTCVSGFTGDRCENDTRQCIPNPCRSGLCSATINGYRCNCFNGFTGTNCDVPTSTSCSPNPCKNGGRCSISSNQLTPTCTCPFGYTGDVCEFVPAGGHATNIKSSSLVFLFCIISLLMGLYQ